ncbi:MAG: hypothetical protein IJ581_02765 [Paludibacteraceae bacterium]|nr:hypothetical protein [Paludibacteraceae bacterium]
MRKFYSLLVVALVAVSAMALPQRSLGQLDAKLLSAQQISKAEAKAHVAAIKKAPVRHAEVAFLDTIDIVATNLQIEATSDGRFSFNVAAASDGALDVEIYFYGDVYGSFTEADAEDISVYLNPSNDPQAYFSAELISAEVAQTAQGDSIDAWVYDEEGHVYHLQLSFVLPEATETVVVTFDEPVVRYYYATTGDYYIAAEKAGEYIFFVDIFEDGDLQGQYSIADIDKQYTGLYHINGTDTTSVGFYTMEVLVQAITGGDSIFVSLLGKDARLYELHMAYYEPVAERTEQLNAIYDANLGDYRDSYGEYQIMGYSTDSLTGISLMIVDLAIGGSYTEKNLDPEYTAILVDGAAYGIVSANFVVELSADGNAIIAHGTLLATNGVAYEFSMSTGSAAPEGIEDVNAAAKAAKFIQNGQLIIRANDLQYNAQGAILH